MSASEMEIVSGTHPDIFVGIANHTGAEVISVPTLKIIPSIKNARIENPRERETLNFYERQRNENCKWNSSRHICRDR
jgi:hypothetical protein